MPYRLIYSSEAAKSLAFDDLQVMLAQSRVRNQKLGITGVLIFVEGTFLQILEGDQDKVTALMAKIERDPRHSGTKVFYAEEVDDQVFSSWDMAYVSPNLEQITQWLNLDGTRTMESIISTIESEPERLPDFIVHILKSLSTPLE